jgi:hypothetical protein
MKNHRFPWLRNRTTDNRKCEKARNIKEKRTIEMFSTVSKQLVELLSSLRDNLRNLDLRSNLCFTRVCGVVRCGEKRWNLLGSQRICNTFATKISKKYRTLFGDRHWRVSFLLCRFCVGSYAVLIF